jgi:hypothetical protein
MIPTVSRTDAEQFAASLNPTTTELKFKPDKL